MDKKTIILSLIILILSVLTIVNYQKRMTLSPQQSQAEDQKRAKSIVDDVATIFALDRSVEPTVAAITNIEKLRATSPFYANAKNGDYVIITRSKAIIYSQEKHQIIDVIPIELKAKGKEKEDRQ